MLERFHEANAALLLALLIFDRHSDHRNLSAACLLVAGRIVCLQIRIVPPLRAHRLALEIYLPELAELLLETVLRRQGQTGFSGFRLARSFGYLRAELREFPTALLAKLPLFFLRLLNLQLALSWLLRLFWG